ncbi:MAG: hypothetical protein AB2A00_00865 [Myxococcota bacterium]
MPNPADIAKVRAFISRELDTISEYVAMAEAAEDPVVKELFIHVAREEKEHVAEGMRLLHALDPDQASVESAHAEALLGGAAGSSLGPLATPVSSAASTPASAPPDGPGKGTFTVGNLRRGA